MKSSLLYYITYERSGKGYVASVPAVPGCVVFGRTLQAAHKNIQAALKECLEVLGQFEKRPPREVITPKLASKFSFVRLADYAKN